MKKKLFLAFGAKFVKISIFCQEILKNVLKNGPLLHGLNFMQFSRHKKGKLFAAC